MTQAPVIQPLLPGTDGFDALLGEIAAGAKDRDLNDQNPFDQVVALKRAGFGTLRLPADLGGPGFSVRQLFSTMIDVAHADPIVAHIFRTHFWFVEERLRALRADPADAVSRRWLDEVAAGKLFANAFSEKGTLAVGSLVFNTRLLPDGDGAFRLERREVLQHRHAVLRLPDRRHHHRPRLGGIGDRPRRPGRCAADRRLGRLRPAPNRHRHHGFHATWRCRPTRCSPIRPYDAEPAPTVQYASLQLYIHAVVAGVLASSSTTGWPCCGPATRSFSHALTESPADDPLYRSCSANWPAPPTSPRRRCSTRPRRSAAATDSVDAAGVPDAELAVDAQLKVAKVKVHLDDVAPEAATRLLELGGASAASRQRNLDRHWRNIRTITLHNPVAYKARVIGENLLHGTPIPANAYF